MMLRPRSQTGKTERSQQIYGMSQLNPGSSTEGYAATHPGKTQDQKEQESPIFNLLEEKKEDPSTVNITNCGKCQLFLYGIHTNMNPSQHAPTAQPRHEYQSGKEP